jgi:5-methylcytosine-specific restriction endonuclease McrA
MINKSEAISYALISIARKSREVPVLRSSGLSVSKASRIVSILNRDNASELIRFAKTHTSKQIEAEVARRNPKAASRDRVKMISGDTAQLTITVSAEFLEMLKRVESLEGKQSGPAIEAALRVYLKHKDPVQKAKRAQKKSELFVRRVSLKKPNHSKRVPLSAAQKHVVFARDEGRCTHIGADGKRCNSDRWVEVHHIRPVSLGGGNEPENLTTLCSFHHDLAHQLNLPLEGQTTWLRSPVADYSALVS